MKMCRGNGSKMTFLLNSALSLAALTPVEIPHYPLDRLGRLQNYFGYANEEKILASSRCQTLII
jgi:hypothetical protein